MSRNGETPERSNCAECAVHPDSLLRMVDGKLIRKIECDWVSHRYRAHQVVFHEGTPPLAVYCIRSGTVKLLRTGKAGEEIVLRVLGPGEAFGYRPILCDELYAVTAEAIEESEICVIPKASVQELLRESPAFALDLLARVARELRISEDQLLGITQKPVLQRAASLLVSFLEGYGERIDGGVRISIPVQRKEMAQMIGTTPETFSRTLHELSEEGIVSVSRSDIFVKNEEELRRRAEK